jgi:hypothetical protein
MDVVADHGSSRASTSVPPFSPRIDPCVPPSRDGWCTAPAARRCRSPPR